MGPRDRRSVLVAADRPVAGRRRPEPAAAPGSHRLPAVGRVAPDGKRFVFAGVEKGHGTRLYIRDIEGGAARALMPAEIRISFTGITVSPNGKSATALLSDGTATIVSIEDGKARPLPGISPGESPVGWSADGKDLFIAQTQGLPARISRLDPATGRRTPWKEIAPSDASGVFGVDPIRMSGDGKSYIYSYRRTLTDLYLVGGLKPR